MGDADNIIYNACFQFMYDQDHNMSFDLKVRKSWDVVSLDFFLNVWIKVPRLRLFNCGK